jgi:hypothetical protein
VPSKFFAFDFKGEFAQFAICAVSATIDNDRPISRFFDRAARRDGLNKNTVSAYSTIDNRSPSARTSRLLDIVPTSPR